MISKIFDSSKINQVFDSWLNPTVWFLWEEKINCETQSNWESIETKKFFDIQFYYLSEK